MTSVSFKGHALEVAKLRSGLQHLAQDLQGKMHDLTGGVLLQHSIPDKLVDDMSCDAAGYSWLKNASFANKDMELLQYLMADKQYNLSLLDGLDIHWNHVGVQRFMTRAAEINQMLSILNHILPSQPPRGTEFMDVRICNGLRMRNLFYSHGNWWFIMQYHKSTNVRGQDQFVPMLIPKSLAQILVYYLIHIRPVEAFFAGILWGAEAEKNYREFLYMQNGKRVTSEQFSSHLQRWSSKYFDSELSVNPYRHIAIALKRAFIPPSYNDPFAGNDVGDLAAGHSSKQAGQTYATEVSSLPFLTSDAMLTFGDWCELWHDVLGFGKNPPPLPLRLRQSAPSGSGTATAQATGIQQGTPWDQATLMNMITAAVNVALQQVKVETEFSVQKAVAAGLAQFQLQSSSMTPPLPDPEPMVLFASAIDTDLQAESSASAVHFQSLPPHPPLPVLVSKPQSASLTPEAHKEAQVVLCQAFNDTSAKFKSPQQAQLLWHTIRGHHHFLAVLPTGGGKSIAWEVPARTTEPDKLAIVVIPYVAILKDMLRRSQALGIHCMQWIASGKGKSSIDNMQILFVAMESAGTDAFIQ